MRISEDMRFPHPVLWSNTGDYTHGVFEAAIAVDERLDNGEVTVSCTFKLEHPDLKAIASDGRAGVGLYVVCGDTYYNALHPLPIGGGDMRIPGGRVSGRVVMRPVAWSASALASFAPSALHEEFKSSTFSLPKGSIIAVGEEVAIQVGREKLAPLESIFELAKSDQVAAHQIQVQLDSERIKILASEAAHQKIASLRGTKAGKIFLLNSIYLPAVMSVLRELEEGDGPYEGKRWHRIFTARLNHLGISLEGGDTLTNAQRVLNMPFARVDDKFLENL